MKDVLFNYQNKYLQTCQLRHPDRSTDDTDDTDDNGSEHFFFTFHNHSVVFNTTDQSLCGYSKTNHLLAHQKAFQDVDGKNRGLRFSESE
jgi:hypothetical protein